MNKKEIAHVLFVCTGNSCRSIMAEAYLKKRSGEENIPIEVKSAGTLGIDELPPTQETLKVLANEGIDPAGYESTALTEDLIEWADIILVMEPAHKVKVMELVPEAEGKIYYLGQFNEERNDIAIHDPIGMPLAFYRASFRVIKQSIEGFIGWLKQ